MITTEDTEERRKNPASSASSVVKRCGALLFVALLSMAHVGSPDTFFTGKAGPYDVRVSVRLPGVIPGRAQVAVRVIGSTTPAAYRVSVRAGQWNLGLKGAPPAEIAAGVPGDPALYSTELWFMTATSYEMFVTVDGPAGSGTAMVPVMALATTARAMTPGLGAILAALGVFLTAGMLTIIGAAIRESVLTPGVEPDGARRQRARLGIAGTAAVAALILWGGNSWWNAEAASYGRFVLYRPFAATAAVGGDRLTLSIRDPRWTRTPSPRSPYNALLPDHGHLMHLFLVRDGSLDGFAHLHPVPRTPDAKDFDGWAPPLPPGRYRAYADLVHESGYAQTIVTSVDIPAGAPKNAGGPSGDDSLFDRPAVAESARAAFTLDDGTQIVWDRGATAMTAGEECDLKFSVRDAGGNPLDVEPYMGMAAHVAVSSRDGSVFAHLHPSGSISMAALQKFSGGGDAHAAHAARLPGDVAIPYAFPKAGGYRLWVQVKRDGRIHTAAFDLDVHPQE